MCIRDRITREKAARIIADVLGTTPSRPESSCYQDVYKRQPYQILINHPELDMPVRSMYTYIDKGLFTARNVGLRCV